MSVITWSSTMYAKNMRWEIQRNDLEGRSIFGSQSIEISTPLWALSIVGPQRNDDVAGEWKSFLMRLKGKTNQAEVWDQMRPVPIGTMRGTMTLNTAAAQGANALSIIAATEAAKTLKQGDLLGLGSGLTQQVVMVTADAVANGSGVIAVSIEPSLRNAFLSASAVTWNQPKALFRQAGSGTRNGWDYSEMLVSGFNLDLIEDWRP